MSFFCLPYTRPPAGLYTLSHLWLFLVTAALVALGLFASRRMTEKAVRRTVRVITALLWALEVAKILFVLLVTGSRNPNDFIPLYYCSITLYAGLFSSVCRGRMRRAGDVFIATAGIVGGAVFLLMPTTSLPRYPALHFISFHSFLLHGLMVYLGLLMLMRHTVEIDLSDMRYPAAIISVVSVIALVFNRIYDAVSGNPVANLMFLSKDFPGTPISLLYHRLGLFFSPFMCLIQAFGPFILVWGILQIIRPRRPSTRQN